MSENKTDQTAIVELEAKEARNAKIAARKEGMSAENGAIQELDRSFEGDPGNYPSGKMRFMASATALCEIAMKAQSHGKSRREKGHNASQSKYYRIGDKMESQLVRQGVWVEGGKNA